MTRHIEHLADDPKAFAAVLAGFVSGIAEGCYPAERRTPNGDEECLVVEVGDRIVAFATFYRPDHRPIMWLDLLWVDADRRRSGLGEQLVRTLIRRSRDQGVERVELGTGSANAAMQALAAKLHFEDISRGYQLDVRRAAP